MLVMIATLAAIVPGFAGWWSMRPVATIPTDLTLDQLDDYGAVPAFALTERAGTRVTRDDLVGIVWVADFIYTECTETCPTQSLQLARLQREFAAEPRLRLVSITVDPEHDTPAVLRRYAERYGATDRWWFVTGDADAIYCLARNGFRLSVVHPGTRPSCGAAALGPRAAWASHGSNAMVMHSARFVLVDAGSRIRAYHLATDPGALARLSANVRTLLDELPRPPALGRR